MRKLRLCVCKKLHKCLDSDGEWDGTWDEWYEYIIHNSEGEIVDQESGFQSKDKARKARLDAIRLADKLSEDGKTNVAYTKKMGAVLGVKVKTRDIVLQPLQNIRDFFEEGSELHHCVFTNGYYRHKDCLIIGARVNGRRTETIEIDTREWKIVQCRGKHNQPSRHHTRIMKLMNKNMDIFKKAAL